MDVCEIIIILQGAGMQAARQGEGEWDGGGGGEEKLDITL